jgi:hypothetical protein
MRKCCGELIGQISHFLLCKKLHIFALFFGMNQSITVVKLYILLSSSCALNVQAKFTAVGGKNLLFLTVTCIKSMCNTEVDLEVLGSIYLNQLAKQAN